MLKPKDVDKLRKIKRRQVDLRQCHGEDIRAGKFLRVNGHYIAESEWLLKVVEHLLKTKIELEPEPEAELTTDELDEEVATA